MAYVNDQNPNDLVTCPHCGNLVKRSWLKPVPDRGGIFDGSASSFAPEMSDLPPDEMPLADMACADCLGEPLDDEVDSHTSN